MKKRTLSCLMAALLLFSCGAGTSHAQAGGNVTSPAAEQDDVARVKEYFGWEDYTGTVDTTYLRCFHSSCDNEEKMFLLGHSKRTVPKVIFILFDPVTLEDVFTYKGIGSLQKNKYTPTDYFTNGEVFRNLRSYVFNFRGFTEEEREYYEKTDLSIDDYARMILKINPDLNSWYSKNNSQPTFEELDYLNTVPSYNDDRLVKKSRLSVSIGYIESEQRYPLVITERRKENAKSNYYDVFSGELLGKQGKLLSSVIYVTTKNANKKIWWSTDSIDWMFESKHGEARLTRAFRACIEIIDDIEYVHIGKLRKIYENLSPDKKLDYSMYLREEAAKPE